MIAIIDYDAGNIRSVEKALKFLGQDVKITRDPEEILSAEKVILPGVGAFGDAMGKLKEYGLDQVIRKTWDPERRDLKTAGKRGLQDPAYGMEFPGADP